MAEGSESNVPVFIMDKASDPSLVFLDLQEKACNVRVCIMDKAKNPNLMHLDYLGRRESVRYTHVRNGKS